MEQDDGDLAARISAMRREAYSRSGSEATFAALRELEQQLADSLLAPGRSAAAVQPAVAPAVTPPVLRDPFAGRRIGVIAVAGIIIAATIIAIAGFSLGRLSVSPLTSATPSLPASAQRGSATLALLETPQRPADVPPFSLGTDIIPATVHVLPTDQQGEVTLYGARTRAHLVCLVAVTAGSNSAQLGDSAETCATVHEFVTSGIRLRVTTSQLVTADHGPSDFAYFQYRWTGNGEIADVSNRSPIPPAPHR